jgi:signal peptidase
MLVISVGPRLLPYQVLPVLSGSMEPEIPTGSLIVEQPVASTDVRVGDVITYTHPLRAGALVTHRVVAIEDDRDGLILTTKGDANELVDSWRVRTATKGWRYALAIPHLGSALLWLESGVARSGLFAAPVIALALVLLFDIWRPRRRLDQTGPQTVPGSATIGATP